MNARRFTLPAVSFALALALVAGPSSAATKVTKVAGLLDFSKTGAIVVDGQRITKNSKTTFKGAGPAKTFETIPPGYEVKVEGTRQTDGSILATKVETKPNGMAMYESDVIAATNQAEQQYVKAGKIADVDAQGKEHDLGALHTTGPEVDRCRKIVDRLLPSYIDPKSVRVYVVDNKEWNAMAMANYSIFVFSGIMKDLDDDEMAIVLGHELTHATYEHSRRQASKGMYTGIAGMAASVGLSQVKSGIVKDAASTAASVGLTTFGNVIAATTRTRQTASAFATCTKPGTITRRRRCSGAALPRSTATAAPSRISSSATTRSAPSARRRSRRRSSTTTPIRPRIRRQRTR